MEHRSIIFQLNSHVMKTNGVHMIKLLNIASEVHWNTNSRSMKGKKKNKLLNTEHVCKVHAGLQ